MPGDNDWTDCWGRYGTSTLPFSDPEERLNFERTLFFSTDRSLGQHTLKLTRQTSEGYPENQRWKLGPVVYLGLNVQGSNDNFAYLDTEAGAGVPVRSDAEIQRQRNEEMARKAADLRWLDEGFDYAKQVHAKGVMIIWQADPNFNNEQHLTNPHDWDALPDYVDELRTPDRGVRRSGRARPRRHALLQSGQAAQPHDRRRRAGRTSPASRPLARATRTG